MRLGVAAALVDGVLVPGDVEVDDGRITAVGVGAGVGSAVAVPGLVDLQVNGFAGVEFTDSQLTVEAVQHISLALDRDGVTTFLPDSRMRTISAVSGRSGA